MYCKDYENNFKMGTIRSTCSQEASEVGSNQSVVTYSYFNGKRINRNYTLDIQENLENIRLFYPGWLMRVYSDMPLTHELCNLVCEHSDFYFCPVEFADELGIGTVSKEFPMQWRFLVLGDNTVQKFLVRDLDSRITQREADAVIEWERSSKIFHAMRDHPGHYTVILGGMWGGNNLLLDSDVKLTLQRKIVMNRENHSGGIDQAALKVHIYPFRWQNQLLVHDSFLCHIYKDSVPFPTQRKELSEFVGRPLDEKFANYTAQICPERCRPSYGHDWKYC
ncbi:hypothetical protein HA402_002665 [Bradysia odoriphaga]|nr:hypothetical protein HA402_002665 [Bradysia odoriphaga]